MDPAARRRLPNRWLAHGRVRRGALAERRRFVHRWIRWPAPSVCSTFSGDGTAKVKATPFGCLAAAAGCGNVLQGGTNVEYVIPSPDGQARLRHGARPRLQLRGRSRAGVPGHAGHYAVQPHRALSRSNDCTDADGDPIAFPLLVLSADPAKGQLGALQGDGHDHLRPARRLGRRGLVPVHRDGGPGVTADPASVQVDVAAGAGGGGTVLPAGLDGARRRVLRGSGLQRRQPGDPAWRRGGEGQPHRIENCDGLAEPFPTLTSGVATSWAAKGNAITLKTLQNHAAVSPRAGR